VIVLQEVAPDQLAYFQGELPEFTPLTVLVVDPDPPMTAVTTYLNPPSPYEAVCFLDAARFIAERQLALAAVFSA
jgi:hypothetical protein